MIACEWVKHRWSKRTSTSDHCTGCGGLQLFTLFAPMTTVISLTWQELYGRNIPHLWSQLKMLAWVTTRRKMLHFPPRAMVVSPIFISATWLILVLIRMKHLWQGVCSMWEHFEIVTLSSLKKLTSFLPKSHGDNHRADIGILASTQGCVAEISFNTRPTYLQDLQSICGVGVV